MKILNFIIFIISFMCIWILGCALADYYFEFNARSWSMAWGYIVAITGKFFAGYCADIWGELFSIK